MKKIFCIFILLAAVLSAKAQDYTFEAIVGEEVSLSVSGLADDFFSVLTVQIKQNGGFRYRIEQHGDKCKVFLIFPHEGEYDFDFLEQYNHNVLCRNSTSIKFIVKSNVEPEPQTEPEPQPQLDPFIPVEPEIVTPVVYETSVTESEPFVLKVTGYTPGAALTFSTPDAEVEWQDELTGKISLSYPKEGVYVVTVTQTLGSCHNSVQMRITVNPKKEEPQPEPEPEPDPEPQPEPEPEPEPVITPDEIKEIELTIPNVFTPDGDGINDCFHINYDIRPQFLSIEIFNRNGQKVYSSKNPDFKWAGSDCRPGTYFYTILYSDGKSAKKISGFIHKLK